jgi:hypothetical protein
MIQVESKPNTPALRATPPAPGEEFSNVPLKTACFKIVSSNPWSDRAEGTGFYNHTGKPSSWPRKQEKQQNPGNYFSASSVLRSNERKVGQ